MLGAKVTALELRNGEWRIGTTAGDHAADFVINCAGLHCDRVSMLAGEKREVRIVPFRGEYYKIRPERQHLVRNLIYPVPDPQFPFLGVHFTRLIHGGIEAGPNAVLAFAREGYRKTDIKVADLWDALTFSGLWRFLAQAQAHELGGAAAVVQPAAVLRILAEAGAGDSRGRTSPRAARACARRRCRRTATWSRTSAC